MSYKDVKFVSYFGKLFGNCLGPRTLKYPFALHYQIDGQTKVVNSSLGDLIRCLVGEKLRNWDLILPLVTN